MGSPLTSIHTKTFKRPILSAYTGYDRRPSQGSRRSVRDRSPSVRPLTAGELASPVSDWSPTNFNISKCVVCCIYCSAPISNPTCLIRYDNSYYINRVVCSGRHFDCATVDTGLIGYADIYIYYKHLQYSLHRPLSIEYIT